MTRREWRQCGRKTRYRTPADARPTKHAAERRDGLRLRLYECPVCGGWHLTKRAAA